MNQIAQCDWLSERGATLPARSVKMAGYWPRSFLACLWTETNWPHTWSITIYLEHMTLNMYNKKLETHCEKTFHINSLAHESLQQQQRTL